MVAPPVPPPAPDELEPRSPVDARTIGMQSAAAPAKAAAEACR